MMFSRRSLIPTWIFLIFFAFLTEEGLSNASVENNSTLENDGGTDVAQENSTTDAQKSNQTDVPPEYVVGLKNGQPCLLATFNITIRVSYDVKSKKEDESPYVAFKDVEVPAQGAQVLEDNACGENQTSLILNWGNSTFNLNLTFISFGINKNEKHVNWTLVSIVFGYDMSNHEEFPGATEDDYVSLKKDKLKLFNSAIGHTKECDSDTLVDLGDDEKGADFTFHYVRLAAFNLTSEEFPEEVDYCVTQGSSNREEDIVVPLIIACSLSLVIVIVVIAYAISRKVQEARDQTQYKPMP